MANKKALSTVAAIALAATLFGCTSSQTNPDELQTPASTEQQAPEESSTDSSSEANSSAEPEPAPEPEGIAPVTASDYFSLDGLYLDSGYEDPNGSNAKMLYVFYTVTAPDSGLQTSSVGVSLRICTEEQALSNPHQGQILTADLSGDGKFMRSYHYDNTVETVKYGTQFKMLTTYLIAPSQMEEGSYLKFEDADLPGIETIVVPASDIVTCKSAKAIAKQADPKGYKKEQKAHKKASNKTSKKVNAAIDGYEFFVSYQGLMLKFYFEAPNYFEARLGNDANPGTYEVQNGYLACTYDSGKTVDIPWSWDDDGNIDLDILNAVGL